MKHIQPFEQFMNEKSGGTGHLANAKYYWKIFNKKQKIDFLVGAGYSKSVANDLSNEDWDSLEIEVHKNLASVLENFVNEGYSSADKRAINDLVVKSIASTSLSGANPKFQILNARVIDDTTIELETEFETVQYKITKIKP